jgi:hypothetical protein
VVADEFRKKRRKILIGIFLNPILQINLGNNTTNNAFFL